MRILVIATLILTTFSCESEDESWKYPSYTPFYLENLYGNWQFKEIYKGNRDGYFIDRGDSIKIIEDGDLVWSGKYYDEVSSEILDIVDNRSHWNFNTDSTYLTLFLKAYLLNDAGDSIKEVSQTIGGEFIYTGKEFELWEYSLDSSQINYRYLFVNDWFDFE